MATAADSSTDVDPKTCPVIEEWLKMEVVVARAGAGKIAHLSHNTDRDCVSSNADLLVPLIKAYGPLAEIYLDVFWIASIMIWHTQFAFHT